MVKTFYKKAAAEKIFFSPDMKVKSYAYGREVWLEFIEWRKSFLTKWNAPNTNFLLLESGSIDGNCAKIDKVGELRVTEPKNQRTVKRKANSLSPLWFEGMYFEVSKDGELIIDGRPTDKYLGTELKAWGATFFRQRSSARYMLFVFGKNESGEVELRGYSVDSVSGVDMRVVCSVPLDATLSRKAHLYCFGKHIFLINDSKLNYYYFNDVLGRLEEVAIKTDELNDGKDFCANVASAIVCDGRGYVYWQSGNSVYAFPIGYPRRLCTIDIGERNELVGIQTFRETLYVYRRNKITREYSCLSYVKGGGDEFEGDVFNRGAKYNMFYSEKNGILHYVKVPSASSKGYVARKSSDSEAILSEIDLSGAEQMFCVNGNLYLNYSYVSAVQIKD